ncbi:hypothetical protein GYMLUDRAFT_56621 [Collybiopsis luxurians FD-317 M1]|nr:hypothetical protein GYMLUDRAFT_56621 [Collybiopsis luxurians FD-317 M1]
MPQNSSGHVYISHVEWSQALLFGTTFQRCHRNVMASFSHRCASKAPVTPSLRNPSSIHLHLRQKSPATLVQPYTLDRTPRNELIVDWGPLSIIDLDDFDQPSGKQELANEPDVELWGFWTCDHFGYSSGTAKPAARYWEHALQATIDGKEGWV